MKRLLLTIIAVFLLAGTGLADKKNYIVYSKDHPFPGYIRTYGVVDVDQPRDGSTVIEDLENVPNEHPNLDYKLLPRGPQPDPQELKWDVDLQRFVSLEAGDITPKAQAKLDQQQKAQDIVDNLPSWNQVETAINNISSLAEAKAFLKKLARVVYWDVKNQKD